MTTVEGLTIHAPNTSYTDDTPSAVLSRVVRRIAEKGLHVVGLYGGGWERTREGEPTRTFEVDVATSEDAEPLGQVIVRHTRSKAYSKRRGFAFNAQHDMSVKDTTRIGWSGSEELFTRLGWRE